MNTETILEVPVLIVGGGGAGLTSSLLLSSYGVSNLLITRYPGTSSLPRGHILHQRTLEVMSDIGIADQILDRSTPPEHMRGAGFYSGLAGGGPSDGHGRRLGFIEAWGGGYQDPDYIAASPFPSANLSLLRTEPILKVRAESEQLATVRFHHELVDLQQDANGITSKILNHDTGETYSVRSQYVLGADGGRTVAEAVGIEMGGQSKVRKMVSLYFSADLSEYLAEADDTVIQWFFNPNHPEHLEFGAVLVPQGPTHWGRHSEEWLLVVSRPDVDASKVDQMVRWGSEALGIPNFDPEVHGVSEWWLESVLAETFQADRVFLLGDAAHRVPPAGGLGLNSAVQDAYNLCWKLSAVLAGRAGPELLNTYTVERRPVNAANIEASTRAAMSQDEIGPTLGLSPDKSAADNWASLQDFWRPGESADQRRHEFSKWLGRRTSEFRQHAIDFGYAYEDGAIVDDGTTRGEPMDPIRLYEPSTRPGSPLPHAWVERAGRRSALRDLTHGGHFALIAGEEGLDWVVAAARVAADLAVPLRAARVGIGDVDYVDVRLAWRRHREITPRGAVLVRPDGHVAFRAMDAVPDPQGLLRSAIEQILCINH